MKLLLDTHLLLWVAGEPEKLSSTAASLLLDPDNQPLFSSASIWEIVIKNGLGRSDFRVDPRRLWRMLLASGYQELAISSEQTIAVAELPLLHKDPFDRILVAQARMEQLVLLSTDATLAQYGEPVRIV